MGRFGSGYLRGRLLVLRVLAIGLPSLGIIMGEGDVGGGCGRPPV